MIGSKLIKLTFLLVLLINVAYFYQYYTDQETQFRQAALDHVSLVSYVTDDQVPFTGPYTDLNSSQKISYLLQSVANDKHRFWLAHTEMTEPALELALDSLPPPASPMLSYDPRLTLAVYLDEIKTQLLAQNPENHKDKDHLVAVPFDWSDWVDLTLLNTELAKPVEERLNCDWLQSNVNKPTKHPDFCTNLVDLSDEEVQALGYPSKEFLPGFVVNSSPMNKAPHEQAMFQGKAHLMTFQQVPLSLVFLTLNGTYEAQVSSKQRMQDGELVKNYLERRRIGASAEGAGAIGTNSGAIGTRDTTRDIDSSKDVESGDSGDSGDTQNTGASVGAIVFDPTKEFSSLLLDVPPRPLDTTDDIYKMNVISRHPSPNASRDLILDPESFHYSQQDIDEQILEYDTRLHTIADCVTNELHYNVEVMAENKLSRHELNHYNSLKYANSTTKDEPTYYKLATLLRGKKNNGNKDTGWHYEWRFFNGGLRQLKEGWTVSQLEIREQIILDRLIRNWFRFAEEKGIISWIAHGPLLLWYWDGLMFPYDIDVDIQMPATELNRLAKNYNMTLVVEDINDGYGKYLIDCSTFLHHRNKPKRDNHIDARFIDIDSGTYIDITGLAKNDEKPPPEYNRYIKTQKSKGAPLELYMDRRKHWLNYEKISPIRYSMIGGVPVYVPNDIMSMLNHEYAKGTKSYHFGDYFYVPILRLWITKAKLTPLLESKGIDPKEIKKGQMVDLLKHLTVDDKLKILESNDEVLMEYYLTHKITHLHEIEKKFMLDHSLQHSITDVDSVGYRQLTLRFNMGTPLRKALFDYEYIERFKHNDETSDE